MKTKEQKEIEKLLEEINEQMELVSGIRNVQRESRYYDASSNQTIHGDENIKKYLLEKYFKKDMEDIVNGN